MKTAYSDDDYLTVAGPRDESEYYGAQNQGDQKLERSSSTSDAEVPVAAGPGLSDSVPAAVVAPDPTLVALSSRARDLSLAITNPASLARKLRESLIDLVGPEQSRAYHIGAAYSSETGEVQVQIAAVSPHLLARLQASTKYGAELEVAYQRTVNGWEVAVGAKVRAAPMMGEGNLLHAPDDYALGASFSVTVRR